MARLFVAVGVPDEVLDVLALLPRPPVAGVRWTGRDQWHVTLRFLGQVHDVASASASLSGLRAGAALAVLGPAVDRFGQRVLHVPVAGLDDLAAAVVAATRNVGRPPEDRPFVGHLTLARVARGARPDLRRLAGAPVAGRWPVTEVCLMESRLSPAGARYEIIERVVFAGPPAALNMHPINGGNMTTTTLNWPVRKRGDRDFTVPAIQYLLNSHGASIAVDGDFGPNTEGAVRAFQSAHSLTPDGIVGNRTWPALIVQVSQGSTGDAVRAVQNLLNLTEDGIFGPKTDKAVREFQQMFAPTVDGIVGPVTWNLLVTPKGE